MTQSYGKSVLQEFVFQQLFMAVANHATSLCIVGQPQQMMSSHSHMPASFQWAPVPVIFFIFYGGGRGGGRRRGWAKWGSRDGMGWAEVRRLVDGGWKGDDFSSSRSADILFPILALIHFPGSFWIYTSKIFGTGPSGSIWAVEACFWARD